MSMGQAAHSGLLAFLLLSVAAILSPAHAAEARYCFALDQPESVFYASPIFETRAPNEALERAFARELAAEHIPFRVVSCPRADDRASAEAGRRSAIDYNRTRGKSVRDIGWAPSELVTHE